jgi:hypothetical protein
MIVEMIFSSVCVEPLAQVGGEARRRRTPSLSHVGRMSGGEQLHLQESTGTTWHIRDGAAHATSPFSLPRPPNRLALLWHDAEHRDPLEPQ